MYKVKFTWIVALATALPLIASAQDVGFNATPESSSQGPIQIDADSGEFDNRVNAYKLFGNVTITHDTLTVRADEGFAYRNDDEDDRVELYGEPTRWTMVLEDGTEANGQSDKIVYNLSSNIIVMIGQARVQDSRGVFTGARLTYNVDTQTTEGEGGVQVVIEPPDQDDSDQE